MFAVALLAFLGTGKTSAQVSGPSGSQTFGYEDGAIAPFLVPGGVSYIYVDARGGHGGSTEHTAQGGRAGQVSGVIPVTPGELLGVQVGGWGNAKGGLGCAASGAARAEITGPRPATHPGTREPAAVAGRACTDRSGMGWTIGSP